MTFVVVVVVVVAVAAAAAAAAAAVVVTDEWRRMYRVLRQRLVVEFVYRYIMYALCGHTGRELSAVDRVSITSVIHDLWITCRGDNSLIKFADDCTLIVPAVSDVSVESEMNGIREWLLLIS